VNATSPNPSPPTNQHDDWETLEQYRTRLNIEFNFKPSHIPAEYCRYMTVEQCKYEDEIAAVAKRDLRTKRELQSKSSGVFNALVLLVRFSDHADRKLPTKQQIEEMCNGSANYPMSIKHYFDQQSYGKYQIECQVVDWITTDNTEDFYAQGKQGILGSRESQLFFHAVLNQIDEDGKLPNGKTWFDFDVDNDSKIDAVVALHSGYAAEAGGKDCNNNRTATNRINSQGHMGTNAGWSDKWDNFKVSSYSLASALDGTCGSEPAKIGTITHEWIHTLGAPDVYDLNTMYGGLGAYDIMSDPRGGKDPAYPGSVSPWTKMQVNWLEPIEITQDGEYTIQTSQNKPEIYIIRANYPDGEYLLIENRQRVEYDNKLVSTDGLLIYKVDESKKLMEEAGFPGQSGWPANRKHYEVALLQADGNYDLERSQNHGDAGDVWVEGMTLGPHGKGSRDFPNTDSYSSNIYETGITITDISAPGNTMKFRVSGLSASHPMGWEREPDSGGQKTPDVQATASGAITFQILVGSVITAVASLFISV